MSLEDLQNWMGGEFEEKILRSKNYEENVGNCLSALNITHKQTSQIEKPRPSSQLTRRLSENNPTQKESVGGNKENTVGRLSIGGAKISKTLIEKNNSILVQEINIFRLLYKML